MNVFILTLAILHAKRFNFTQPYIVICDHSGFTIVFHIMSLTARVSEKVNISVLIFSTTLSATFLVLRRIERGIVINLCISSCIVPVNLVRF